MNLSELGEDALGALRQLLAQHDAQASAAEASTQPAEQDWGLGGILHLILDHIHVREDLRAQAHTAVDALAEAAGEVADTVAPQPAQPVETEVKSPEGA